MSSVARGRCLVLTTIIITLLGNLVFAVLPAVGDSIPFFAGTILGFCAVAALLYAMWRGQNWARWLLVAIYLVGLALRLTLIFRSPHVLDIARAIQQFVRSSFAGGTAERRGYFWPHSVTSVLTCNQAISLVALKPVTFRYRKSLMGELAGLRRCEWPSIPNQTQLAHFKLRAHLSREFFDGATLR